MVETILGYAVVMLGSAYFADRKSTRLNSSHRCNSYAVFCLKKKKRAGLVQCTEEVQSGRPSRKVYRITASGQHSLDDWLLLPPTDEPRPLRDDLSVKLTFSN